MAWMLNNTDRRSPLNITLIKLEKTSATDFQ